MCDSCIGADRELMPAEPLTRLFVVVGHVAVKQIAHLETLERHWKRRRHDDAVADKARAAANATVAATTTAAAGRKGRKSEAPAQLARGTTGDDLEAAAATGSAEDEFSDSVALVREQELLGSNKALLGVYGPLAAHVAASARSYEVRTKRVWTCVPCWLGAFVRESVCASE
jgi:condensin complex subunit 1